MKLGKLTIHNIASIEDAEIDFGSGPLSESEVFLIAGKTGAGKSTILDAICLALYADTPRLANTNMQGESRDTDRDIKIDDPRQLMRRNTGEAFASLSFTGNNQVNYEATWSIARARNKPTGNLQSKKWVLKNLDNGNSLTKDREITDEIQRAVGLDFRQFCRTTLLAQGEFTRFLNSSDKDKAEILEKITGVDIYSRIGKEIYDITEEKRRDLNEAQRKVEDTKLLSEEETERLRKETEETDAQLTLLTARRTADEKKLTWMRTDSELAAKTEAAAIQLRESLQITLSEVYKEEATLTSRWNESIEARAMLNRHAAALRESEKLKDSLRGAARSEFAGIREGELHIKRLTEKTEKSIGELRKLTEEEADKAEVYANAQKIAGWLASIEEGTRKMHSEKQRMLKQQEMLDNELARKKQAAVEAYAKAKRDSEEQQTSVRNLQKELDEACLPQLRKEKERLQDTVKDAETALERLDTLKKEAQRHIYIKEDLTRREKQIAELTKQLDDIAPLLKDAEKEEERSRKLLDSQKETVESWAKTMRARLRPGDTCPVCRQTVAAALPSEEDLEILMSTCARAYEDARKRLADLILKQTQTRADIRSQSDSLANDRKRLAEDSSLADAEKSAARACAKCNVADIHKHPHDELASIIASAKTAHADIVKKTSDAELLEKKTAEARNVGDRLAKEAEKARECVLAADRAIADCKAKIATGAALIKSRSDETAACMREIEKILGETKWETDPHTDIRGFAAELERSAKEYADRKERMAAAGMKLREYAAISLNVADSVTAILTMMPEWSEVAATETTACGNLQADAAGLRSRVQSAIDRIKAAESNAKEASEQLAEWLAAHEGFTAETLSDLDRHTAAEISGLTRNHAETDKELANRQTLANEYTQQREAHTQTRPEMTEKDTGETLKEAIADTDRLLKELSERKGAIMQQLKEDSDNRQRLKEKIAEAGERRKVFERWDRLNQLIGNARGDRFRKVAQSYVLANLIRTANGYMRTLSDRYRLKVEPGTFVIMLEDAWQGYTTRAASTISGGECFLVSLALALALSDIGQTLQVDTLFIDEGFGSLSGEPLQNAIATLHTLHKKGGRHVGIISHVEELKERIPVQIQVRQQGNESRSVVGVIHLK